MHVRFSFTILSNKINQLCSALFHLTTVVEDQQDGLHATQKFVNTGGVYINLILSFLSTHYQLT